MTTNIQTIISELQERNREKINYELLINADRLNPETIDEITTDSFNAGALAVIGEIKIWAHNNPKDTGEVHDMCVDEKELIDHLSTLEATLKDPTPTPQDQNGHKINSDGSLCYDAKCRHCVRKDVIRE